MKISDLEGEVKIKAIAYSRRLKYHFSTYAHYMSQKEVMRYPFSRTPVNERHIHESFNWAETPEGHSYWSNVNITGKP